MFRLALTQAGQGSGGWWRLRCDATVGLQCLTRLGRLGPKGCMVGSGISCANSQTRSFGGLHLESVKGSLSHRWW